MKYWYRRLREPQPQEALYFYSAAGHLCLVQESIRVIEPSMYDSIEERDEFMQIEPSDDSSFESLEAFLDSDVASPEFHSVLVRLLL